MAKKSFLGALQTDNPALAFLSATAPQQQDQPEPQPVTEEPVTPKQDNTSQPTVIVDEVVTEHTENVENIVAPNLEQPTTVEVPIVEDSKLSKETAAVGESSENNSTDRAVRPTETAQASSAPPPIQPTVSDRQTPVTVVHESDRQNYEAPEPANVVSLIKPVRVIEPKRPYNRQDSSIVVHEQASGMLSFTIEKPKEKKTVRFSVMTRQSTKDKLMELSRKTGRSVNDLVDILVTYGLSKVDMNGLMVLDDD